MNRTYCLREELQKNEEFRKRYCSDQKRLWSNCDFLGRYQSGKKEFDPLNANIALAYSNLFSIAFCFLTNMYTEVVDSEPVYSVKPYDILIKIAKDHGFKRELDDVKWRLSQKIQKDLFLNMEIFQPLLANYIKYFCRDDARDIPHFMKELEILYDVPSAKVLGVSCPFDLYSESLMTV